MAELPYDPENDVLEREYERLWYEIRRLFPRYRVLYDLGEERSEAETEELRYLDVRIEDLRRRTRRYREVLRNEALARDFGAGVIPVDPYDDRPGPNGTPIIRPRLPGEEW